MASICSFQFWPLALLAVPCAFLGGWLNLPEALVSAMNWRYAMKQFDAARARAGRQLREAQEGPLSDGGDHR